MAGPIGNKNAVGNRGGGGHSGGRLKAGDVQFMLDLWNGRSGNKKIVLPKPKILYEKVKETSGKNKGKFVKHKIGEVFESAKDAFTFKVLMGNDWCLRDLINKLYADIKAVEIINKEDQPIPIKIYLPEVKKVGSNQTVYVPKPEKIYPAPDSS